MTLTFYKYQGTGNDFVIIDNRLGYFPKNDTKLVAKMCDRKFGIGADGLMLLEKPTVPEDDFVMVYYNADGNESTMCGNGGRCLVAFAAFLGVVKDHATFTAVDGKHTATIDGDAVRLQMQNVTEVNTYERYLFLDTGSPHHVMKVDNLQAYDVKMNGSAIRNGAPYFAEGTNVNFVERVGTDRYAVRTYERGVEDETLSCGTGVTAVAIGMHELGEVESSTVQIETPGGELEVSFEANGSGYKEVYLTGPAKQVFKGEFSC